MSPRMVSQPIILHLSSFPSLKLSWVYLLNMIPGVFCQSCYKGCGKSVVSSDLNQLTSITVPLVITPSCVYIGDWGFFFTPMSGKQNVAFSCVGEKNKKAK